MVYEWDIDWKLAYKNFYLYSVNQLQSETIKMENDFTFEILNIFAVRDSFWFIMKDITFPHIKGRKIGYIGYDGHITIYPHYLNKNSFILTASQELVFIRGAGYFLFKRPTEDIELVQLPAPITSSNIVDNELILNFENGKLYNYMTKQYFELNFNIDKIYIKGNRAVYKSNGSIYISHFPDFETLLELDYANGYIEDINDNFVLLMPVKTEYDYNFDKNSIDNGNIFFEVYDLFSGQLVANYDLKNYLPFIDIKLLYSGQIMIDKWTNNIFISLKGDEDFVYKHKPFYRLTASSSEPYFLVYVIWGGNDEVELLTW